MDKLENLRNEIDKIDEELMELLNKRLAITKEVGLYKKQNLKIVNDKNRENNILEKADKYLYSDEIKKIYKYMFELNKFYQGFRYGLIAKDARYSLSPLIYQYMGMDNYHVIGTDDFDKTISKLNYDGINITNPFKVKALDYSKSLDDSVIKTNTVNMIYNGRGYNTDYLALQEIFSRFDFKDQLVIVIGNGATSRSVKMALNGNVIFLVREVRGKNEYLISEYEKFIDAHYIINTTPFGTYPNISFNPLFSLERFKNLKLVFDVVYNPINTPLIMEAKKYNIKGVNGLEMLFTQAAINYKIWFNQEVSKQELLTKIKKHLYNIVLIGMSFSGKTTLGKKLSESLNKQFVDIDIELKNQNKDIDTVLKTNDITVFRKYEKEETILHSKKFNQVISTGGGVILSVEAMNHLMLNGIIVYLKTSVDTLKTRMDNSRPLLKNKDALEKMYYERIDKYEKYSMITIDENMKYDEILEIINEAISH